MIRRARRSNSPRFSGYVSLCLCLALVSSLLMPFDIATAKRVRPFTQTQVGTQAINVPPPNLPNTDDPLKQMG